MKQSDSAVEATPDGSLTTQNKVNQPDAGTICRGCDTFLAPLKITCMDGRAQLERPKVTLARGMDISWTGLSDDQKTPWTVTFHKSPAEDGVKVFDQGNSDCVIGDVRPGRYAYTAHLQGCRHAASGSIEVVLPDQN